MTTTINKGKCYICYQHEDYCNHDSDHYYHYVCSLLYWDRSDWLSTATTLTSSTGVYDYIVFRTAYIIITIVLMIATMYHCYDDGGRQPTTYDSRRRTLDELGPSSRIIMEASSMLQSLVFACVADPFGEGVWD